MVETETTSLPLPLSLIQQLRETPQNPKYHAEGSVYNHTLLVLSQFVEHHSQFSLSDHDHQALYLAVLLHDVGKPVVTRWVQGRWSARGHEAAGVPIARDLLLGMPEVDASQRQRILSLVRYHSAPLQMGLRGASLHQYKQLATKVDLRLLGQFAWFDLHGRICVDQDQVYAIIDQFLTDIVPRVEYEMGTFSEIQSRYQTASHQRKNALWHALQQERSELLEKLLLVQHDRGENKPLFEAVIPVAPPLAGLTDYLHKRFEGFERFHFELPATPMDSHHLRSNLLRTVRHFVSVFGKEGKNLLIEGPWIEETFRKNLLDAIRQQGGAIRLLLVEGRMQELEQTGNLDGEAKALYEQQQLPHPWEAHYTEFVEAALF